MICSVPAYACCQPDALHNLCLWKRNRMVDAAVDLRPAQNTSPLLVLCLSWLLLPFPFSGFCCPHLSGFTLPFPLLVLASSSCSIPMHQASACVCASMQNIPSQCLLTWVCSLFLSLCLSAIPCLLAQTVRCVLLCSGTAQPGE